MRSKRVNIDFFLIKRRKQRILRANLFVSAHFSFAIFRTITIFAKCFPLRLDENEFHEYVHSNRMLSCLSLHRRWQTFDQQTAIFLSFAVIAHEILLAGVLFGTLSLHIYVHFVYRTMNVRNVCLYIGEMPTLPKCSN